MPAAPTLRVDRPFPLEARPGPAAPQRPRKRLDRAGVRRLVLSLLRFDRRHAELAGRVADRVAARWEALPAPPRRQFESEWVASVLWAWLRSAAAASGGPKPRARTPFLRPLSEPVSGLLDPYRRGVMPGRRCVIGRALDRQAA